MQLSTEVKTNPLEQKISYGDKKLFLGSCFADEVGKICRNLGFDALLNPFGVLFNPMSIASALTRLKNGEHYTHDDVISVGEGEFFCTFEHNTEFWETSEKALLDRINNELEANTEHFKKTRWVIISLGTAWVYRDKENHKIVSNCHKLPSQLFERSLLTVDDITIVLSDIVKSNPDKNFIFTVSPLRHLKDGLHENQLSKASLLLAVDAVCKASNNAFYFPAYEILLDELRDYRFYKEDMTHPTEQAVHYIWEKFIDFAIAEPDKEAIKMVETLQGMMRHRPMFPNSRQYDNFVKSKEKKAEEIRKSHPEVIIDNVM